MKVIFIKDLKGQGKKNDIKEVKDGYGMNYLIKNGYALPASEGNLKQLNTKQKNAALQEQETMKQCEQIKEKLEKITISIPVKTGVGDKVFGSVSTKQIITELKEKGFNIDKTQVKIQEPISSLGTHIVLIELHKKVIANIKVNVTK